MTGDECCADSKTAGPHRRRFPLPAPPARRTPGTDDRRTGLPGVRGGNLASYPRGNGKPSYTGSSTSAVSTAVCTATMPAAGRAPRGKWICGRGLDRRNASTGELVCRSIGAAHRCTSGEGTAR
jgi:hypothetical protein